MFGDIELWLYMFSFICICLSLISWICPQTKFHFLEVSNWIRLAKLARNQFWTLERASLTTIQAEFAWTIGASISKQFVGKKIFRVSFFCFLKNKAISEPSITLIDGWTKVMVVSQFANQYCKFVFYKSLVKLVL